MKYQRQFSDVIVTKLCVLSMLNKFKTDGSQWK